VLANEQVIDGKCWRHDAPDDPVVEQREVKQWFFKITDYADELLEATNSLDWTASVKRAQKNWIGKSKGAEINFEIAGSKEKLSVFTTRPETLFGVTFIVLAPEHELVEQISAPEHQADITDYVKKASKRTELERQTSKDKTGVFTGAFAVNPATGGQIPIWIADYVLAGYGTGAIMAVPGHDQRDYEFAKKFDLPVVDVIEPETGTPQQNPEFRRSIVAIVRNPKTNEFLSVNWGKMGGNLFVGGGREENEDIEKTALREVAEETGYKNLRLIATTGKIHHNYFAVSKNVARRIEAHGLLFDLENEERSEANLEENEQGKFTVEWLPQNEVESKVKDELHATVYQLLVSDERFHGEGVMANSSEYNGKSSAQVRETLVADLAQKGVASEKTIYKMRDWSVSRQRYWGAPIPIIYCLEHGAVLVPDSDLPVVLPELEDFQPSGDGRSALARATDWLKAPCPTCGKMGERETDTLDTYICSSWYMMRYFDPENTEKIFDSNIVNKWMPIDFYNGADHATAHMIYARFVTRFFYKKGLVENPEPFKRFLFNGKVTAQDGQNFSKSKGNGVDPLEIINDGYGADALRTYLMFAAPLELWVRWDPQGVPGTYRFLARIWALVQEFLEDGSAQGESDPAVQKSIHKAIKKVTEDIEDLHYNTAIAAMMQCVNELYKAKASKGFSDKTGWKLALESLVQLVAPFAPHITEELWHNLGNDDSVHSDHWPKYDESKLASTTINIAVQVNGKVRATLQVQAKSDQSAIEALALADERVKQFMGDKKPAKVVYVPGRLISIVV